MVFSTLIFIFAFLTVTLVLYFGLPKCCRMAVLFVMSIMFYGWGEPKFIAVMAVSILSAYGFAFLIDKYRETDKKKSKLYLIISVCISLSFLAFFKYSNFLISNLAAIPFLSGIQPISWVKLPVGISFYTFQIMSYTIDVYRGDARISKKLLPFATYVTLFPQLIAGPIVRYKDIDDQLREREENTDIFASGVRRFVAGLGKKILLADTVASIVESAVSSFAVVPTTVSAWVIIIGFTFQIYFDFSAYSDMAIGLGRMFGFEFLENFNYPYISVSITDFWRRWHISLSTWFREYVYIPLGGNRRGLAIQYRNIAAVWLLTGIWHGASWNFIIWGCYFGLLLMLEKAFILKTLAKLPKWVSHVYALFFIMLGWLIFKFTDLSYGVSVFGALFGVGVESFATPVNLYDLLRCMPLFCICLLASTPLPKRIFNNMLEKRKYLWYAVPVLMGLLLILCIAYLVDSTFSPFLYHIF